jgi:Domain of unknown function (DUF4387)
VAAGDVRVIPYPLGRAIKIVMPRRVTAGDPGDTDANGAQQHGLLPHLHQRNAGTPRLDCLHR